MPVAYATFKLKHKIKDFCSVVSHFSSPGFSFLFFLSIPSPSNGPIRLNGNGYRAFSHRSFHFCFSSNFVASAKCRRTDEEHTPSIISNAEMLADRRSNQNRMEMLRIGAHPRGNCCGKGIRLLFVWIITELALLLSY